MTAAPDPRRFKSYLGELRAAIPPAAPPGVVGRDGAATAPAALLDRSARALLAAELAQRGSLLPPPLDLGSDGAVGALLGAIVDAAGRPTLGGGSTSDPPRPMLAASCAVAGMAAERCSELCGPRAAAPADGGGSAPANLIIGDGVGGGAEGALRAASDRCREVGDSRLLALLDATTCDDERERRRALLRAAAGHFLRAASEFSAPDQPQMWKRCLDAVLRLRSVEASRDGRASGAGGGGDDDYLAYRSTHAAFPLSNLIRIAEAKGNARRGAELRIRLAESCLGDWEVGGAGLAAAPEADGAGVGAGSELARRVAAAFWDPYHRDSPADGTLVERAAAARAALDGCDPGALPSSGADSARVGLLRAIAALRVGMASEDAQVEREAGERRVRARNRSDGGGDLAVGDGGGASGPSDGRRKARPDTAGGSPDGFWIEARRDVWTGDDSAAVGGEIDAAADALRDRVLHLWTSAATGVGAIVGADAADAVLALLGRQADRLVERGRAVGLRVAERTGGGTEKSKGGSRTAEDAASAWGAVRSYVAPVLRALRAGGSDSADADGGGDAPTAAAFPESDSPAGRDLASSCARAMLSALWMGPRGDSVGRDDDADVDADELGLVRAARSVLSAVRTIRRREEAEARRLREEANRGAAEAAADRSPLEAEAEARAGAALSAASCRIALAETGGSGEGDGSGGTTATATAAARAATEEALRMTGRGQTSCLAQFGAPYLQLLLAWSGLRGPAWLFCTVAEARSIVGYAEDCMKTSAAEWGRTWAPSTMEGWLIRLGEADAEGGLPGGVAARAGELYQQVLGELDHAILSSGDVEEAPVPTQVLGLIRAHCLCGLARLSLAEGGPSSVASAEEMARQAIESLELEAGGSSDAPPPPLYPWREEGSLASSASFRVCLARQLVAESLLRSGRPRDARRYLTDAARDAPADYGAAFALGSFLLRGALFPSAPEGGGGDPVPAPPPSTAEERGAAKAQLLRAARLDPTRADPFALLGLWYEAGGDVGRAAGCHARALALDPSHPVSGRGTLRLRSFGEARGACETAAGTASPVSGWAWRALGRDRASSGDDDEAAAGCLRRALRCRDVDAPEGESLGIFYSDPAAVGGGPPGGMECGEVWAELAGCYRRLGKYSASHRAYAFAHLRSGGRASPAVLCAWGQVELDLGLYEDAAVKFEEALSTADSGSGAGFRPMAAYGLGSATLAIARVQAAEGKFGAASNHLRRGIDSLLKYARLGEGEGRPFGCVLKLLGDMHTFGGSLPPSAFATDDDSAAAEVRAQVAFVAEGEAAFRELASAAQGGGGESRAEELSAALCDIGSNLLLQGSIVAAALGEGSGGGTRTAMCDMPERSAVVRDRLHRAAQSFREAVGADPSSAPAWCGLGCALLPSDPLLAQHCLCRALQLDRSCADAWSNLGMLLAEYGALDPGAEAIDALTQVADTPLMWIGMGLLFERARPPPRDPIFYDDGGDIAAEVNLGKAADAYRAALQVAQHPAALLGLALTCRRIGSVAGGAPDMSMPRDVDAYASAAWRAAESESRAAMSIYLHSSGGGNAGAAMVGMLLNTEDASERYKRGDFSVGDEAIDKGAQAKTKAQLLQDEMVLLSNVPVTPGEECTLGTSIEKNVAEMKRRSFGCGMTLESLENLVGYVTQTAQMMQSARPEPGNDSGMSHVRSRGDSLAFARHKVNESPESGEQWLSFSKELLMEIASIEEPNEQSRRIVSSALKKTKSLLMHQATDVTVILARRSADQAGSTARAENYDAFSQKSAVPESIDASLLSESLALSSWFSGQLSTKEDDENNTESIDSLMDLQKSLILDPANSFARARLDLLLS